MVPRGGTEPPPKINDLAKVGQENISATSLRFSARQSHRFSKIGRMQNHPPKFRKPESWLETPTGSVARSRRSGFTRIRAYCVGRSSKDRRRCWHEKDIPLDALPDTSWEQIAWRLRCTKCGSLGYVNLRVDWTEVIDFHSVKGLKGGA